MWTGAWIAVAYFWLSIVAVFQAQRQVRQKLQPPRLRAGSVNSPEHPGQAHLPTATRARAAARSNMRSRIVPQRSARSASLQLEAKIGEIGRINPPAQLARAGGDLQSVGTRFDGSNLYQFPLVDIFSGASRI